MLGKNVLRYVFGAGLAPNSNVAPNSYLTATGLNYANAGRFAKEYPEFFSGTNVRQGDFTKTNHPQDPYLFSSLSTASFLNTLTGYDKERNKDDEKFTTSTGTGAAGGDLSGFNKDRRSLTINFNDAIVKWNTEITTDSPEVVVSEVRESIEQITSEAIQKALLSATGKMNMSW
jgi:hypothetical protein